jgi:hypothetical protein
MSYRVSQAPGAQPAGARDTLVFSAPGEPFAVRQRNACWSNATRRSVGVVLAAPALFAALSGFFADRLQPQSLFLFFVLGGLLWMMPVDCLFFSVEQLRGMTPVRRGLSVAPSSASSRESAARQDSVLMVDGREAGAVSDVRLFLPGWLERGRSGWLTTKGLGILCNRRLYELVHDGDEKDLRRYAEALASGLHLDSTRVRYRAMGSVPASMSASDTFCVALSGCLAVSGALGVHSVHHVDAAVATPWLVGGIGAFAVVARATAALLPLARCFEAQRGDRSKRFVEAYPRSPRWVTRRTSFIAFGIAHALLAAVAVSAIVLARES